MKATFVIEPDWAKKARALDHKPEFQDKIPRELYELGKVFFPIPPRKKGWMYPHHMDEYRYEPDDEILNAYFDAGWGYGIACDGDLVVVDIDNKELIDEIVSDLPATAYQWTGSGDGVHLFYLAEGIENKKSLRLDSVFPHPSPMAYELVWGKDVESVEVGDLKANPHGYVVGPGSVHPSGNIYGPLEGGEIARVEKEEIEEVISRYTITKYRTPSSRESMTEDYAEYAERSDNPFYSLTADDIMPWLGYGERISHPVHGSSTGGNFMKNDQGNTFVCWRCQCGFGNGCVISAQHLLAMMERPKEYGSHACEEIRSRWRDDSTLHYHAWRQAVKKKLISLDNIPYTVLKGFMVETGGLDTSHDLEEKYVAVEQLTYEMQAELRDDVVGSWDEGPPNSQ